MALEAIDLGRPQGIEEKVNFFLKVAESSDLFYVNQRGDFNSNGKSLWERIKNCIKLWGYSRNKRTVSKTLWKTFTDHQLQSLNHETINQLAQAVTKFSARLHKSGAKLPELSTVVWKVNQEKNKRDKKAEIKNVDSCDLGNNAQGNHIDQIAEIEPAALDKIDMQHYDNVNRSDSIPERAKREQNSAILDARGRAIATPSQQQQLQLIEDFIPGERFQEEEVVVSLAERKMPVLNFDYFGPGFSEADGIIVVLDKSLPAMSPKDAVPKKNAKPAEENRPGLGLDDVADADDLPTHVDGISDRTHKIHEEMREREIANRNEFKPLSVPQNETAVFRGRRKPGAMKIAKEAQVDLSPEIVPALPREKHRIPKKRIFGELPPLFEGYLVSTN